MTSFRLSLWLYCIWQNFEAHTTASKVLIVFLKQILNSDRIGILHEHYLIISAMSKLCCSLKQQSLMCISLRIPQRIIFRCLKVRNISSSGSRRLKAVLCIAFLLFADTGWMKHRHVLTCHRKYKTNVYTTFLLHLNATSLVLKIGFFEYPSL